MASNGMEIVLITGANTGLGFEIAKKFLKEHAERFYVLVGARNPSKGEAAVEDLHSQGLKRCEFLEIDVSKDDSIATAASTVEQKFGRLDVLHANAGIAPEANQAEKRSLSKLITEAIEINVAGAAQTAEAFMPLLSKANNPRLIFMSSGLGSLERCHAYSNELWPAYSASKAALNMIMLYFYHVYPAVKVNACSPGFRATALNNFGQAAPTGLTPGKTEDGANNAVRLTLLDKDGGSGTHTEMVDKTREIRTVPW